MFAETDDLVTLLEIQHIDLSVMQAKKKRAELPQRIEVMRLRKKRDEIREKLEQVIALQKRADAEMTIVEDEDRLLAEKQARAQEIIDASGSDYRKVESHSKEMAGAAKRREELAAKILELTEQSDKISGIRKQLEGAIDASEVEEARLRADFEGEDNALIDQIKDLGDQREHLQATVPADLMALYAKSAKAHGGVGIGRLMEDTCGVCRTVIAGGRLIELKAQAPLGTCPACKRLLVVD